MNNIIGRIPGYNKNISNRSASGNDNKSGINYENRLRNNLTEVKLSPTGYSMNIPAILDKTTKNGFFEIDGKVKAMAHNTITAVSQWNDICLKYFASELGTSTSTSTSAGNPIEELKILCTNDSTVNEGISNQYGPILDSLSSAASATAGDAFGRTVSALRNAKTYLSATNAINSLTGNDVLKTKADATDKGGFGLLQILADKALGIQTSLPDQWKTSSYENTMQFVIKLVSPSGHPDDIKENIEIPLKLLLAATAPISYDGISQGWPPLWNVEASGLQTIDIGAITNMTITRGGMDTQFNIYQQPLMIDIRLTIEPIIKTYSSVLMDAKAMGQSQNKIGEALKGTYATTNSNTTNSATKKKYTIKL